MTVQVRSWLMLIPKYLNLCMIPLPSFSLLLLFKIMVMGFAGVYLSTYWECTLIRSVVHNRGHASFIHLETPIKHMSMFLNLAKEEWKTLWP